MQGVAPRSPSDPHRARRPTVELSRGVVIGDPETEHRHTTHAIAYDVLGSSLLQSRISSGFLIID